MSHDPMDFPLGPNEQRCRACGLAKGLGAYRRIAKGHRSPVCNKCLNADGHDITRAIRLETKATLLRQEAGRLMTEAARLRQEAKRTADHLHRLSQAA